MSTLRISNIEAKSVPASATVDEKVKITNSSGDTLVFIDGKTSGITTVGINTTDGNIKFDANSNVLITGILTATTLSGNFTPDSLEVGSNIKLGNAGVITATTFVGGLTGDVTGSTGTFTGDLSIAQNLVHTGDTDTKLEFHTDSIKLFTAGAQKFRIYDDGVVSIGQSSKSSTVGVGGLDIQGNATNCIIEMGNPFPGFSGGVVPEFRITATNSGHEVKFESIWGGDNALHPHMAFTGGRTHFYKATNSDEIARFDSDKFFIGQTTGSSRLCVSDTNPVIAELHHSDGGTNDEARLMLGALSSNPPNQRGAGIAAVNNGAGHDLTVKCSTNHSSGPSEKVRFKSNGDVSISDGNLIVASGHGIDFSATGGVTSGGNSELFDDYEEGSFTATLSASGGGATFASGHIQTACLYVKIGSMVHVQGYFSGTNVTGGGTGIVKVSGLPFASNNTTYYTICLTHNTMTAQQCTGAYIQYANTYFFPIQTGSTSGSAFNVGNPRYLMFGGSYPVQF